MSTDNGMKYLCRLPEATLARDEKKPGTRGARDVCVCLRGPLGSLRTKLGYV